MSYGPFHWLSTASNNAYPMLRLLIFLFISHVRPSAYPMGGLVINKQVSFDRVPSVVQRLRMWM